MIFQALITEISALRVDITALRAELKNTLLHPVTNAAPPAALQSPYTLFSWLDEWYAVYKAPTLKDGGYDLNNNINKHVKPNIENKPLNAYNAADITKALNAVKSERMRQIVRQIYNQSFREAVRLEHIEKNPLVFVKVPAHEYNNGRTLERAEEKQFLYAAKGTELYALFAFYLLTGARLSEPFVLTWDDITADYIRIRGTKTRKSDRLLPLTDNLKALLTTIKRKGKRVFPYTYSKVRHHFEALRERLPFTLTLKDLRHTFGTRCLESGVNMKTLQKWLGHTKYDTTADYYSHITTDFEREEIARYNTKNKLTF